MSMERIKRDAQQADQMIAEMGRKPTDGAEPETATERQEAESEASNEGLEQTPVTDPGVHQNDPGEEEAGGTDHNDADRVKAEAEKWEQRYRSLDGMIQARDKQIQQLHDLLAGMQEQQSQAPRGGNEGQPEAPSSEPLVTKADEDNFGSDLVDMSRRAAREELGKFSQDLQRQFDALRNELKGISKTAEVSAQDSFEGKLDKVAPNWRTIDSDARFIAWLDESTARKQVFGTAVQHRDARAVGDFFNEFERIHEAEQTRREEPAQKRRQELEKQVAPGKSKKAAAPESRSDEKKTWTRSEIVSAFANKKQYPADEFAKLEREIASAQREGRVDFSR